MRTLDSVDRSRSCIGAWHRCTTLPESTESWTNHMTQDTRTQLLAAGKSALLESGYASLSTRRIADAAGVPLSQIHYHFGSRQNLVLAVLADENARLLERQSRLYGAEMP